MSAGDPYQLFNVQFVSLGYFLDKYIDDGKLSFVIDFFSAMFRNELNFVPSTEIIAGFPNLFLRSELLVEIPRIFVTGAELYSL